MLRFLRRLETDIWDEYMELFRDEQSILRPRVLPPPRLTRLGMMLAFGGTLPGQGYQDVTFYRGKDTSLAGAGWIRRNEIQGGRVIRPDPRLACQIALYSAPDGHACQ